MLPAISEKSDLVFLVLQLFCLAHTGFRAISRVLNVFGPYSGLKKIPCHQTIINWVIRLSIFLSQNIGRTISDFASSGYIWMIDTSIALGAAKTLAVIAVRADHYNHGNRAPTLKDARCINFINAHISGDYVKKSGHPSCQYVETKSKFDSRFPGSFAPV